MAKKERHQGHPTVQLRIHHEHLMAGKNAQKLGAEWIEDFSGLDAEIA